MEDSQRTSTEGNRQDKDMEPDDSLTERSILS